MGNLDHLSRQQLQEIGDLLNKAGNGGLTYGGYLPPDAPPEVVEYALKKFQEQSFLPSDGVYNEETEFTLKFIAEDIGGGYKGQDVEKMAGALSYYAWAYLIPKLNRIKQRYGCEWDYLPDSSDPKDVKEALKMFQIYARVNSNQDGLLDNETEEKLEFYANAVFLAPSHEFGSNKSAIIDVFGIGPFAQILRMLNDLEKEHPKLKDQISWCKKLILPPTMVDANPHQDTVISPFDKETEEHLDFIHKVLEFAASEYPVLGPIVESFAKLIIALTPTLKAIGRGTAMIKAAAMANEEIAFIGPFLLCVSAMLSLLSAIIYGIEGVLTNDAERSKKGLVKACQGLYTLVEGLTVMVIELFNPAVGCIIGVIWMVLDLVLINDAMEEAIMGIGKSSPSTPSIEKEMNGKSNSLLQPVINEFNNALSSTQVQSVSYGNNSSQLYPTDCSTDYNYDYSNNSSNLRNSSY